MTNDLHRSQFRLPYPLYERLKASAEQQQRSLNSEIVARLESSYAPVLPDAAVAALVTILDAREARLKEWVTEACMAQKQGGKP